MFGRRHAREDAKKREKTLPPPAVDRGALEASAGTTRPGGAAADPSPETASVAGLTIGNYAVKYGVAEAEVWRRLRRGEVVGRTQQGRLMVYPSLEAAGAADGPTAFEPDRSGGTAAGPAAGPIDRGTTAAADPRAFSFADFAGASEAPGTGQERPSLPPLPGSTDAPPSLRAGADAGNFLALGLGGGVQASSPELALLLDHLSLAKEENREILRMTQESIRKVTQLSDLVVEMKDTVIDAKETEIVALREQLATRNRELGRLRQQHEDLEMLARSMAEQGKSN